MRTPSSNVYYWTAFVSIAGLSLLLKLSFIEQHSYWLDEAFTRWFALQSLTDLWVDVPKYESHPPFYYTLTKFWNSGFLPISNFSERYLSLLFNLLLLLVFFLTLQHTVIKRLSEAFVFALLIGFSPVLSLYSIEARPYMLTSLGFALGLWATYSLIIKASIFNWRLMALLVLGGVITNWSHALGALFSLSIYITLLIFFILHKDKQGCIRLFICALLTSIACIPLAIILVGQVSEWTTGSWVKEPSIKQLRSVLSWLFYIHFHEQWIGNLIGNNTFVSAITALIKFSFLLILVACTPIIIRQQPSALLLYIPCFFPLLITFFISYVGPNIFVDRTLIPSIIPALLLVCYALSQWRHKEIKMSIFALLVSTSILQTYTYLVHKEKEPWEIITATLDEELDDDAVVLLLPSSLILPFNLYANETLLEKSIGIPFPYPVRDSSDFHPSGTLGEAGMRHSDLPQFKNLIQQHSGKIYYLYRGEKLFDPERLISNTLETEREKVESREFTAWLKLDIYAQKRPPLQQTSSDNEAAHGTSQ